MGVTSIRFSSQDDARLLPPKHIAEDSLYLPEMEGGMPLTPSQVPERCPEWFFNHRAEAVCTVTTSDATMLWLARQVGNTHLGKVGEYGVQIRYDELTIFERGKAGLRPRKLTPEGEFADDFDLYGWRTQLLS